MLVKATEGTSGDEIGSPRNGEPTDLSAKPSGPHRGVVGEYGGE
jgi:hypothetical protein